MTESPRSARPEEFHELLTFLNDVFGEHVRPGIEMMYPTFFRPVPDVLDNLLILREDRKIVSHVGIQRQEAVAGEACLKVGFVGAVATAPDYRGRGYASVLMKDAIRKMREEEYDVSLLGGFRDYYQRFGYEMTGAEWSIMIWLRNIEQAGARVPCEVWPYDGGETDVARIMAAHEAEPLRVRRTAESCRLLLAIPNRSVYCAQAGDRFAYVAMGQARWSIGNWKQAGVIDFGGPCDLIFGVLRHLFANRLYDFVWIHTPASPHPLRDRLLPVAQEFFVGALANMRVINLRRLLERMQPVMTRRLLRQESVICGAIGIEVADAEGAHERVLLSVEKDGVSASSGRAVAPRIRIDSLQLAQLLFGMDTPSRWCSWLEPSVARLLDQVLPLDFYTFKMDHI